MTVPGSARVSGHFGEWIQGRLGPNGPLALVTVPCPQLYVDAAWTPAPSLTLCQPDPPLFSHDQGASLLQALGYPPMGRIRLTATMVPGRGTGASTASLTALARARGAVAAEAIARACCVAEGASDPLMYPEPERLLWAPRLAEPLETSPAGPDVEIVGGFLGEGERTDPADIDFPDISDLLPDWRRAAATQDAALFAQCASISARRTTAHRGPNDDPTEELAQRLGALGHLRAHTGSARGLIFRKGEVPHGAMDALRRCGLADVLRFHTRGPA